ncbi:MAG TPA: inositol monophosphatase family protein [Gemmataceae bacterium]
MTDGAADPALLGALRAAAEEAARRGAAVLDGWRARFRVREKAPADLVTDADLASQEAIHTFLAREFPGHAFLGEEQLPGLPPRPVADGGGNGQAGPDERPTWVVDPIDGTINYVHDVPFYCVSVGLWAAGDLRVGAVYDPRGGEMFSAAQGQGATLNGHPIRVSPVPRLREALLSTGFPADVAAQLRNLDWWRTFAPRAQSLRRTGSTALNLAYVAAGRFEGYWAFDNSPWDVAAGVVLVREAGGFVTRADGSPCDPFRPDILATNGLLHAEMLECLRGGPGGG